MKDRKALVDEGYGIFAWIRDGDGNRVELYQPGVAE